MCTLVPERGRVGSVDDAIRTFWDAFRRLHPCLAEDGTDLGEAYDALLESVQKVDPGLFLELCVNMHPKELIVTAEGKKKLFPVAEAVVRQAPKVKGWTFLALKPKLGFPITAEWEGSLVRLEDVWFEPLPRKDGGLDLQLYVKGLHPENALAIHNALLRALDHGLGERAFADQIRGTDVAPAPQRPEAELIPLTELEAYLRKRR